MTEADWCNRVAQQEMRQHLSHLGDPRRLRLFAVACCRRAWHLLPEKRLRRAVLVAEQFADGHAHNGQLQQAADEARGAGVVTEADAAADCHAAALYEAACAAWISAAPDAVEAAYQAAGAVADALADCVANATADPGTFMVSWKRERAEQWRVLQDVFGPPIPRGRSPVAWPITDAIALARAIYQERAFERLPELADRLQAAGCTDAALLGHLRSGEPHVRGCWALDAMLAPP